MVEAIFKATIEGPNSLMEVYACHEKGYQFSDSGFCPADSSGLGPGPETDPAINQMITWLEDKRLDTVKVGKEMSQELKPYLWQKRQLCL